MRKYFLSLLAAATVSSAMAQAYVGGAMTAAELGVNCNGTLSCSTNDGGGKVYGGYVTQSGIGVEFAYLLLGAAKSNSTTVRSEYEATGVAAAAVFRGAISRNFWVHTKLGLARVTMLVNSRTATVIQPEQSESVIKPYFSVGADFGLFDNVKLMSFIDVTKGVLNGDSISARMAGLGVEFIF